MGFEEILAHEAKNLLHHQDKATELPKRLNPDFALAQVTSGLDLVGHNSIEEDRAVLASRQFLGLFCAEEKLLTLLINPYCVICHNLDEEVWKAWRFVAEKTSCVIFFPKNG